MMEARRRGALNIWNLPSASSINTKAVARTYQFLTSMKGNGTDSHVSGIKQVLILIGGKQVALEQSVVYTQLVKANP